MAIPKYDKMYREFLDVLSDGKEHKIGEIRDKLATVFNVTEEERKIMLPSRKHPLFNDRVNWTSCYLKKAGLIENISRGMFRVTDRGSDVLTENISTIDNNYLRSFDSFKEFLSIDGATSSQHKHVPKTDLPTQTAVISSESPQDILEDAYDRINVALVDDVLSEIMKQTPVFFEHLVVKLLTQMGYGGSIEDAGLVTRTSGDEGIDGIIREDKLGFSTIYIQAKRWDRKSAVGRPELQKFVGALAGQGASKGLFITTAQFTKEAKEYANKQHTTKIVLVDGVTLAKLMIEYNIGVSVETTYAIKRIDSDFFSEELN